jgi:hypothetical protein
MCPTLRNTESARKSLVVILMVLFWVLLSCTGCSFPRRDVVLGNGFLDKQLFFELPEGKHFPATEVLSLSEVRLGERGTRAIAVFGFTGGYYLAPHTGEVLESLSFEERVFRPVPVDVNGDGLLEIFARAGGGADVELLDRTGQVIWTRSGDYSEPITFNNGDVGDADRDGRPEFYLASTEGLYCLDPAGDTRWVVGQENEYEWVVFDQGVPGREPPRLVAVGAGAYRGRPGVFLEHRSADGELIARDENSAKLWDLQLIRWPTEERPLRILERGVSGRTSGLWILDERGRDVGYWAAADSWLVKPYYVYAATFIRFDEDGPDYLAVLFGYRAGQDHTMLTLYSLDGLPVYQEYLPWTMGLLATRIERYSRSGEVLLVGDGRDRVAVYTLGRSTEKQR